MKKEEMHSTAAPPTATPFEGSRLSPGLKQCNCSRNLMPALPPIENTFNSAAIRLKDAALLN